MNIGEKIKKLRTEKMMTQTELAGHTITRNMLSSIENGTALPSLSTLKYLASKLNVPAGYLLADNEEETIYLKIEAISNIKHAFVSKNYKICRDMCFSIDFERDDEINLILAECSLELGIEAFNQGELRAACEYFDEAIEISRDSVYNTEHICAISAVYFRYMRIISATLSSNVIDEAEESIFSALSNDFSKYAISFEAVEDGGLERGERFVEESESDTPYTLHIKAKLDIQAGRYSEAYEKLYLILINPHKIQEPIMYFVFCDLEVCCKELKDFKGAYEYSNAKIDMLQKMLTDK